LQSSAHKNQESLLQFLQVLCENQVVSNDKNVRDTLHQVVQLIKEEQRTTGKMLHQFEFYPFQWNMDAGFFNKCIADAAADAAADHNE
jgi:hypothetical protein